MSCRYKNYIELVCYSICSFVRFFFSFLRFSWMKEQKRRRIERPSNFNSNSVCIHFTILETAKTQNTQRMKNNHDRLQKKNGKNDFVSLVFPFARTVCAQGTQRTFVHLPRFSFWWLLEWISYIRVCICTNFNFNASNLIDLVLLHGTAEIYIYLFY